MKYYFLVISFLVSLNCFGQLNISVGEEAPEIMITEWVQNEPENPNLSNQFIVIDFWATWCAPCIASVPHMNDLVDKYQDQATFISLSNEETSKVKRTVERIEFKSAVASDTSLETSKAYGKPDSDYTELPMIVLIDNKNIIQWIGTPRFLTEEIMDQFINGTLKGENSIEEIQEKEEMEEMQADAISDSFNSFMEWYKFVEKTEQKYIDISESKFKDPMSIEAPDMFASNSISLHKVLSKAWKMSERDIKLPKKLGSKKYQVMYRNTDPVITYREDFANEILKKLNLKVNSVPFEKEGIAIELDNVETLDKTIEDKYSSFSESSGTFLFKRTTIKDFLDKIAEYSDLHLFYSFSDKEFYDFTIDASNDKKLIKSLESYGFKTMKTTQIVENKIITFNE
ncbi:MAG: redoxin domain-containing protein [Nonlabens sp.]|uniref:TlpA family protein disulfide reductase n=1 Tax=Nonlabens sp. TaxID=1888209 RepID=UPI00321A0100